MNNSIKRGLIFVLALFTIVACQTLPIEEFIFGYRKSKL